MFYIRAFVGCCMFPSVHGEEMLDVLASIAGLPARSVLAAFCRLEICATGAVSGASVVLSRRFAIALPGTVTNNSLMLAYLWVAIGGALGSVARFSCNGLISAKFGETFPWGTLLINVAGSFVIGFVAALASAEGRLDSPSRAFAVQFVMIGLCGGFTTFSSFSLQTLNLLRDGQWLYAAGNILLSVILCMIAVWLGYLLGGTINSMKGS